jgi:hypothetical protein
VSLPAPPTHPGRAGPGRAGSRAEMGGRMQGEWREEAGGQGRLEVWQGDGARMRWGRGRGGGGGVVGGGVGG